MSPRAFLLVYLIKRIVALEIMLGECPLHVHEVCKTEIVQTTLWYWNGFETVSLSLNPLNPVLPVNFNKTNQLKVLIHGYGGLTIDTATRNVSQAYKENFYNLIVVNWEYLGHLPCYSTAYLNTWHVSKCLSLLIAGLLKEIPLNQIHLVGFSLGAHIAGFTGTQLKKTLGITLPRITGLDPALVFFASLHRDWKLDPSDAAFVDVIHTSSGSFGKIEATGHVDFYVNGGVLQPFCEKTPYPPVCSHLTAGLYFAETIRNKTIFLGVACDHIVNYLLGICNNGSTAIMGENVDKSSKGVYYVSTGPSPPFGQPLPL